MAVGLLRWRGGGYRGLLLQVLLMPFYWLLISVAAWIGRCACTVTALWRGRRPSTGWRAQWRYAGSTGAGDGALNLLKSWSG